MGTELTEEQLESMAMSEFSRLRSIEEAYKQLRLSVSKKETVLAKSKRKFKYYENCHLAKLHQTQDTIEKAKINREMAELCQEALNA